MAIGDRIRIVTDEEYQAMSPPRRPRGEKPATTIRFLRRQIANLESSCNLYRKRESERDKTIAEQDVLLTERETEIRTVEDAHAILTARAEGLADKLAACELRRQFLEGYYAKSRETLPGSGPGNPEAFQAGRGGDETPRPENSPVRHEPAAGEGIRGFGPDDRTSPDRRSSPQRALAELAQYRYHPKGENWSR